MLGMPLPVCCVRQVLPPEASHLVSREEVWGLICRCEANGFGLWDDCYDPLGLALYPAASLFNHSCMPNMCKAHQGCQVGRGTPWVGKGGVLVCAWGGRACKVQVCEGSVCVSV